MIPRLPLTEAPEASTAAFLEALRAAGFEGDLSAADGDRTVLVTDNPIYHQVPQADAIPRGTADLARIGRLPAEPRFAGVRIAPRGGGTSQAKRSDGAALPHPAQALPHALRHEWPRTARDG